MCFLSPKVGGEFSYIPNNARSTSKLGAPLDTHSRLHGQLSVARKLTTHGLLHIRYLEKKSSYVTVDSSIRSIASGTRELSSSNEHKPSLISISVDMTKIRSSSYSYCIRDEATMTEKSNVYAIEQRCGSRNIHFRCRRCNIITFACVNE